MTPTPEQEAIEKARAWFDSFLVGVPRDQEEAYLHVKNLLNNITEIEKEMLRIRNAVGVQQQEGIGLSEQVAMSLVAQEAEVRRLRERNERLEAWCRSAESALIIHSPERTDAVLSALRGLGA